MFYFIKRLPALRIVTDSCADHILLFGRFPVLLHHALDVGGFGWGEERLVPLRSKMDNRVNGLPEHFVCLVENIDGRYWLIMIRPESRIRIQILNMGNLNKIYKFIWYNERGQFDEERKLQKSHHFKRTLKRLKLRPNTFKSSD